MCAGVPDAPFVLVTSSVTWVEPSFVRSGCVNVWFSTA